MEHGADIVVHSATKYLNGHSDVLAGAVAERPQRSVLAAHPFVASHGRRRAGPVRGLASVARHADPVPSRRRASETALTIARHFERHPRLLAVLYPGLPSHPGHAIAARQMNGGFGGMLSLRVAGGVDHAQAVLAAVKVFKRATSLGGVESLIEHRSSMEGPSSPVPDDLLRLSIESRRRRTSSPIWRRPSMPADANLADKVAAALRASVLPSVIARGGEIRVVGVENGIVIIEMTGSPGAALPLRTRIEALIRHAVPEVVGVRMIAPGHEPAPAQRCRRPREPRAHGARSRNQPCHRRAPRPSQSHGNRAGLGPGSPRRRMPGLQPRGGDAAPGHRADAAGARTRHRRIDGRHRSPGRPRALLFSSKAMIDGQRPARPAAGPTRHLPCDRLRLGRQAARARPCDRQRRRVAAWRQPGRANRPCRSRRSVRRLRATVGLVDAVVGVDAADAAACGAARS